VSGAASQRTEYRVVGWKPGRGAVVHGPYRGASRISETMAREMRHYCVDVRIETRTVSTTPWVDLPEQGGES